MSKIFKRPMFRRGGEVGGGIMTGVMRENYQDGSTRERLAKVMAEYPSTAMDPLTQFLIQGGLSLASQPATGGGTIADIATALKEPTAGLMSGLAEKGKMARDIALQGEILDIEGEQARELAEIKAKQKDFFAAQTPEAQFEVLFKGYSSDNQISPIRNNARNLATFEVEHGNKNYTQMQYKPIKGGYVPNWETVPVNAITYNTLTGLAYKRTKKETNNATDFIPLDPDTLEPLIGD